ncbi:endonuclease I family protein [Streptomyces triticirhizae]|uniref:Ribonuclease n=1 Tax=Streptomyces triticirhizae TaxID=2483353 RepID=A0A3M2M0D3_9ACTN|nr:endonuclease [Streptomyces triticirhizae]RMI43224.1 ribonuclease [Streptomyces triticirhizae]
MPPTHLRRALAVSATAAALTVPLLGAAPAAPVDAVAPADVVDDYYADAEGLTGEPLKQALHEIISTDVTTLTYSQVWDALKVTDRDPADPDSVILLYTGLSRDADANGGNVGQWNREHVWPQSHGDFGTSPGPGTDLHHLRPSDVQVNSDRGNKDFDEGGTESPRAPGNYTDADSWEPRDEVKGDIARMAFYMAVRWEGGDGFADLEVNDTTGNGSVPYLGRLSTLLDWHAQDPPSAAEEARNATVFEDFQGNRNPFVDHPEWVEEIW